MLLLAALAVFTANPFGILLPAMDDCHYARKGVEMARSGGFFTVTWYGSPSFQHPPLPFWLLGRSFAMLGENDLAARLPSIVLAIGTLLIVYRLGTLLLNQAAAVSAVAWLAISPYFVDNARRCMLDVSLAFWTSLTILIFLEGLRRPRLHLLLAVPLGAAILTKSVLGLLPLAVLGACALLSRTLRAPLLGRWWWIGTALGLAIGASWPIEQTLRFGPEVLRLHFLGQVGHQLTQPLSLVGHLTGFPIHLLERFHPVILPALLGSVLIWRRLRQERDDRLLLLLLWPLVPFVLYNVFGAQETRYLFPLFPPLALCAAWVMESKLPRASRWLRRWIAPGVLVLAAVWLWISPPPFVVQADRAIAIQRRVLQARIPEREPLTYLGRPDAFWYWPVANPLMYYGERLLEPPAPSVDTALARVASRRSHLLLCDREMLPELPANARGARQIMAGNKWVLLDLSGLEQAAAQPSR